MRAAWTARAAGIRAAAIVLVVGEIAVNMAYGEEQGHSEEHT